MRQFRRLLEVTLVAVSMTAVGSGCDNDDGGEDPTMGGSTSSGGAMTTTPFVTTSDTTTSGTTSGTSTSTSTTGPGTSSTTSTSTSGDDSETATEGDEESGGFETEGPVGDINCEARCLVVEECTAEAAEDCFFACIDAFDPLDEMCTEAFDAFNGCIGGLDCDQYAQWLDPANPDPPCAQEQAPLSGCGIEP